MNYVISLGGSIINPSKINVSFLAAFRKLILSFSKDNRFFIVTGGGQPAMDAQAAAKSVTKITPDDLDWTGIAATRVNAELLRSIFGKVAYKRIILDPSKKVGGLKRINIFSGWKPGWSTDFVAVKIAQSYGIKTVINLSNIDYVYDRDPRKFKNAKKFERMTWAQFRRLFGSSWDPGANVPYDPVGAKLAQKLEIEVIILNGTKLDNVRQFFSGKNFKGTM